VTGELPLSPLHDNVRRPGRNGPEVVLTSSTRRFSLPGTSLHISRQLSHDLERVLAGGHVAIDHVAQLADEGDPCRLAARLREGGTSITTTLVILWLALSMRGAPVEELLARPEAAVVPGQAAVVARGSTDAGLRQ
jgi:hypothetical protein